MKVKRFFCILLEKTGSLFKMAVEIRQIGIAAGKGYRL